MPKKFSRGLDELKWLLLEAEQKGVWNQIGGQHQFRATNGGIVNYWPSNSSVNFQGQSPGKEELEALIMGNADPSAQRT